MKRFNLAALVVAFLMPIIFSTSVHAMTKEEYEYEIWKQFNEQFWEQYYEQRDELLGVSKKEEKAPAVEEEPKKEVEKIPGGEIPVTNEEFEALCMIGMNEAGNQGIQGIRYVIACVLNRVDDPNRPNDILGVIYEKQE